MKKFLLSSFAVAVILGSGAVWAQSPAASAALGKYDTNGDGQLSDQEWQAAQSDLLKTYDADGDGQLSESEKQQARQQLSAQYKSRMDTNGDGQVSEAEKQAARQRLQQRRQR